MTIYKHELRETFKSTMIWSVSVALFLMMYILVYPAFQDQIGSMNDIVKNMGNFTEAFGLNESSMSTAFGFYAVEAGLVLSIGGAMFAATSGISMVAKEEANHRWWPKKKPITARIFYFPPPIRERPCCSRSSQPS